MNLSKTFLFVSVNVFVFVFTIYDSQTTNCRKNCQGFCLYNYKALWQTYWEIQTYFTFKRSTRQYTKTCTCRENWYLLHQQMCRSLDFTAIVKREFMRHTNVLLRQKNIFKCRSLTTLAKQSIFYFQIV